jgi:hypothetical protein
MEMTRMEVEQWNDAWGELNEQNLPRRLESQGYSVHRYDYLISLDGSKN